MQEFVFVFKKLPSSFNNIFSVKKKYCFCLSLRGRKDFSSTLCSFSAQEAANKTDKRQIKKRKDRF